MKKKIVIIVALALACALVFSACGKLQDTAESLAQSAAQLISGDTTGEIGKPYKTQWFEFTVNSVQPVDEYAGYAAAEGNQLYDVLISETNIFEESIPMGTADFYMDAESFPDYIYPMDPIDDSMMPMEFDLAPGESAEYHMIYEVPADTQGLMLLYTEIDETSTEGNTFTIPLS